MQCSPLDKGARHQHEVSRQTDTRRRSPSHHRVVPPMGASPNRLWHHLDQRHRRRWNPHPDRRRNHWPPRVHLNWSHRTRRSTGTAQIPHARLPSWRPLCSADRLRKHLRDSRRQHRRDRTKLRARSVRHHRRCSHRRRRRTPGPNDGTRTSAQRRRHPSRNYRSKRHRSPIGR